MQDRAPAHAWRDTERALEASLGPDWRDVLDVDAAPVGTGCVAQVHSAVRGSVLFFGVAATARGERGTNTQVLKKDVTNGGRRGDRVAVKVVHPAARRRVASDLDFLRACARAGEALIPRAKWFNLAAAADEFAATLGAQMDMRAARGRRPETRLLALAGEPRVEDSSREEPRVEGFERNHKAPRHAINQRRRPTTSSACGRTSGTRAA